MSAANSDSSNVDRVPPLKPEPVKHFRPAIMATRPLPRGTLTRQVTAPASSIMARTAAPIQKPIIQPRPDFVQIRIPREITEPLQAILGLQAFVETGTSSGTTTRQMSKRFQELYTIEVHEPTFKKAQAALADCKNITCLFGDSADVLAELLPKIQVPTLFWLDGHYSGPGTGLGYSECPLIAELVAINQFEQTSVVLIDDARFLIDTPPAPHDPAQWPRLEELITPHVRGGSSYWILFEDVVIKFPATKLTIAWFEAWKHSELGQTAHVLIQGTRNLPRGRTVAAKLPG